LRERAEQALWGALGHAEERVTAVRVRLFDVNGPRGGVDKRCSLVVFLDSGPDVVIEDTCDDMYVAVDRAASRAGRAVSRRIARHRVVRGSPRNIPVLAEAA